MGLIYLVKFKYLITDLEYDEFFGKIINLFVEANENDEQSLAKLMNSLKIDLNHHLIKVFLAKILKYYEQSFDLIADCFIQFLDMFGWETSKELALKLANGTEKSVDIMRVK